MNDRTHSLPPDDTGLSTLTEIAVVIFILGIIFGYVSYRSSSSPSHDDNAIAKLEHASALAERVYQSALPDGSRNFAGKKGTFVNSDAVAALSAVPDSENLDFVEYSDTLPQSEDPDPARIWVDVNTEKIEHLGVRIRPGKLIRLGTLSKSGATICKIVVKEATPRTELDTPENAPKPNTEAVTGTAYQAVARGAQPPHPGTGFADCGAGATDPDLVLNEMPGQAYTWPDIR